MQKQWEVQESPPKENSPEELIESWPRKRHGSAPGVLGMSECGTHVKQPEGTQSKNPCFSCVASLSFVSEHLAAQPL